jgi:methylmalonyl-CoA mutase cobalamin-binding subunit
LLRKAVEIGHSISQVAELSHVELDELIASELPDSRGRLVDSKTLLSSADRYLMSLIHHINDLDSNGLQATLDRAAVNLTRMALILNVIVPLCVQIDDMVKTGKLRLIDLNVATLSIQTFLWNMLRTAVVSKSAPKIVIAAPAGQHCEIEALALAIIAMECGWKSIYFGPNLSATDIAAVVKSNRARAVGLSINRLNEKSIVEGEISKLKKNLNGDIDLIICGNGKLPLDHLVKFEGIFVTRIKNFRQKLENLTIENAN